MLNEGMAPKCFIYSILTRYLLSFHSLPKGGKMQKSKLNRKQFFLLMLTSFLFVLMAAGTTALTYYFGKIVDCATQGDMSGVFSMTLIAVGIVALWFLGNLAGLLAVQQYLFHGTLALKYNLMNNVLSRPLLGFRQKNDAYYLNLLGTDMDVYRDDRLLYYPHLVSQGAQAVFAAAGLFLINPWMCLAGLVFAAVPMATSNLFTKKAQKL